jgi:SAM-dependent methyltransferase
MTDKRKSIAKTSDKYVLYRDAVQDPEAEVDFMEEVYRKRNKRRPTVLQEDFCGAAAICCEWVRAGDDHVAIGVDIDPEVLDWSRLHYVPELTPDQKRRLHLRRGDVRRARSQKVDVILALNFSFCIFKERAELTKYMRRCRKMLTPGGILVMDLYGGPEAQRPNEDRTAKDGFTYVWDQSTYNPITNEALNHIHFEFRDGSEMKRAFTYDWRLWTLAELRDALMESGFREAPVYWEDSDGKGGGNGVFRRRTSADIDDAWIAYIVGLT